jgi:SPP1 gp7 family putative phage head morphogenesis protein
MYEAMESAEQTAREIADIYAKASRELNYQIQKVYERYRDKYSMTDEEATKLLNSMKDVTDLDELKQKLSGLKGDEAQEILKELESPAYRARIERMQNLQQEIDRKMKDVYNQEKQVSTVHYVDQYNNAYYREVYDLKSRSGYDYSFSHVDEKQLNRILNTKWSGANYSQRIWGNTQGLANELKTQIALAYLTGKTESDIAAELANKYATGAAKARRLVRTESAYISGQAQAAADKDAGIDRYRILATLDLRTSEICRQMDGQEFDYKDMQVGTNYPPFHPYCRTTVLSVLDDQDLSELQRRSRDPQTGKPKKFPGDITYEDWYKQEIKENPEMLFAEKVEKNRSSDLKQYERYKALLGTKEVGKTVDDFRDIKYNDTEKWQQITTSYNDTKLSAKLKSDMTVKKIDSGKQSKHFSGSNNYTKGRSYLTITEEQCQELVDKYAGTGRKIRSKATGKWQSKEKIVLDYNIGQYINKYDGTNEPTNAFMIVYAKDGTHIIPARKE